MRILIFALVAMSASFTTEAQKKQTPTKPAETKLPQPTANGKIGYIDIDNVISQLPEFKQLEIKLQETQQKLRDDLTAKRQSFETLYTDYMQNGKDMPDSSRAKAEGELQQLNAEIQQFQQDAQRTVDNTKKLFLGPIYLKLGGVIHDVAIENGFSMILPHKIHNQDFLLHSDPKLDVSQLVVKKFVGEK
jgi:outer membrane protein